jgi:predicted enzyme related to lactoylglutathione lyase
MAAKNARFMLWVADMDRALAFYRDGLGLAVRMHNPFWSELDCGGARIALHPGAKGEPRDTGVNFAVDDLDAEVARAAQAGAVIERGPEERPQEFIRIAHVRDTEGNLIYLVQPLGEWAER